MSITLASCASIQRDIIGVGSGSISALTADEATVHRIFVATTRKRSDNEAEFFSGARSQIMALAHMDISIPRSHRVGKIERQRGKTPDPTRYFTVTKPAVLDDVQSFQSELNRELAKRGPDAQDVLIFVHGYNTNFSAAALRVSQFVHDSGYKGVPVLFSWASRGKTLDYVYDINSALQARDELERLGVILSGTKTKNFDVVAHSMGNLVTIEAMRKLHKRTDLNSGGQLRKVILASPDIDIDLFETQIKDFAGSESLFHVLVSDDDKALSLSRRIAGGVGRVGATDPVRLAKLGLNVIDLSEIDDKSSSNHSKFSASPEIVKLIGRGIRDGNTLSAQSTPSAVKTVIGGVFKGITIIPSSLIGGAQAAIITVGN